ncbi:unnamed protein product [Prunus armeniaca]
MGADATLAMSGTRSQSRPSLWAWPGPSLGTQVQPAKIRARTSLWPRVRPGRDQGRRSGHGRGRHSGHNCGWVKPRPSPRS